MIWNRDGSEYLNGRTLTSLQKDRPKWGLEAAADSR
jgi:hypothetical protein